MITKGLIELFPFPGYVVERVAFSRDIVQVNLRRNKKKRLACPVCDTSMSLYREAEQSARDLPLGTAGIVIIMYPALLCRCPKCYDTHTLLPSGISPHAKATDRLMRYISLLARHMPVSRVAEVTGISSSSVRRYDKRILGQDLPPVDLDGISLLLIDEKHLGPSLGYVTLVLDGDNGDLLHMAAGKKKDSLQSFFDRLDEAQKQGIDCVCIDRAGHYKEVVEINCPDAVIVFDKFHLKKNLNDAIDKVRRQEWHKAEKSDKKVIKGQRYNLLRAPANNTAKQRKSLKDLLRLNENLSTAYVLREAFDKVWSYTYRGCAERYLKAWTEWAQESKIKPLCDLARSFWKSKDHIVAYVDWPVTTGMLECLNGIAERIKRRACGLQDLQYFYLKLRQAAIQSFGLQT